MRLSFSSILMTLTERCRVGCNHCGLIGSRRQRDIQSGDLNDWTGQLGAWGLPVVIYTGGEPFERYDLLRQGIRSATAQGISTSLFTSSCWATSEDIALEKIEGLGPLQHLYLSTDRYHQQHIPYQYVHNAITAAVKLNIGQITLCITYASERDRRAVRDAYAHYGDRVRFYESRVIQTHMNAKALEQQDPSGVSRIEDFPPSCWIDTPIINPNGDLFACHIGSVGAHGDMRHLPYWLGNLQHHSLEEILTSAGNNMVYQYLKTHGAKGVAQLLQEYPDLSSHLPRSNFSGPCDMCFSILSTPGGRQCLHEFAQKPEVVTRIHMLHALKTALPPKRLAVGQNP